MIIENNDKALAEEISSGWRRSKRIDGARKFLEEEFPPVVVTQVDQCDRYDRERAGSFSLYSSFYALLFFLFFFSSLFPESVFVQRSNLGTYDFRAVGSFEETIRTEGRSDRLLPRDVCIATSIRRFSRIRRKYKKNNRKRNFFFKNVSKGKRRETSFSSFASLKISIYFPDILILSLNLPFNFQKLPSEIFTNDK